MGKDKQKEMILNDNLWKVMFNLSWPAIIAMVLYGLNAVFDAFFVGRFVGETALAGVSLVYPLIQIPLGLGSLIGVGAGSALSIAIGANDRDSQKKLLGNANLLTILLSLIYTGVGLLFATSLVRMMGGSGQELVFGVDYFRVTLYGAIFWIAGLAGNMIVRAEGKMKSAAVMMGIGLLVNIIANYILVVIYGLGVKGAAIGTNIGMAVYTLMFFIYILSKQATFDARIFSLRRDKAIMKNISSMGAPSLIMTVMFLIQGVVVMNALSRFGSVADVAFYGIVFRFFTLMLTPIYGLMRALQPVIGINFGARDYDRVIAGFKVFAAAATLIMLPFWLLIMFTPETVLQWVLPDRAFLANDIKNFRVFMLLLPVLPIIFMSLTFFPAINNGKPASILGIARQLIFYVPVMLIMPRLYGVDWVYYGSFGIDFIMFLWCLLIVKLEFNKLRNGIANHPLTEATSTA